MLEWSEEASISRKLQVYENIHECLSFSVIAKADFCNNVLLQILSLVESFFIEIRVLLLVTLQEKLKLVLWEFPEEILFRGVLKPSQTSKMVFIAKMVYIFKSFEYIL